MLTHLLARLAHRALDAGLAALDVGVASRLEDALVSAGEYAHDRLTEAACWYLERCVLPSDEARAVFHDALYRGLTADLVRRETELEAMMLGGFTMRRNGRVDAKGWN